VAKNIQVRRTAMGQNANEYSLLYAAETFEQFEELLQFFEKLDNEGNDT
jgi:hypothetical protein